MRELAFPEIEKLLFGSLRNEIKDGLFIPHRFAPWQEALFEATVDSIQKPLKTKSTASVYLDFLTDATRLELDCRFVRGSTQAPAYIDVYIDGVLKEHVGRETVEEHDARFAFSFGEGEKRVTLFFPNLFGLRIRSLAMDGSFYQPYPKKMRWLAVGDSITQGYTTEFPSLSYVNILARKLGAEVINQAIGGARYKASDIAEGIPFAPDLITVAYGTNDWAHGEDFEKNAGEYFTALRRLFPKTPIVAILPIWRGDVATRPEAKMPFPEAAPVLRGVYERFEGVTVVDGAALVPPLPAFYNPDTLHPNELGFMHYADGLYEILRRVTR